MNACRYIPGGQDPEDAFSLQVVFRKRALELVALLRKMACNLRYSMGLHQPVLNSEFKMTLDLTIEISI